MRYLFDEIWFEQNQKILLFFLNNPIPSLWLRYVLRINGDKSSVANRNIYKITPNAISWVEDIRNQELVFSEEFRTHNKFSKRLYYAFKPIWYIFHTWDIIFANNFAPQLNLGFDSLTVYPDADAETTSVDGTASRSSVSEIFSSIRGGNGTASTSNSASGKFILLTTGATGSLFTGLTRGFYGFDASSLADAATISAATFSVYITAKTTTLSGARIGLVLGTLASNTNVANSDYEGTVNNTTLQSDTVDDFDDIATGAYFDLVLNATGRGNISTTVVSNFGLKSSYDRTNSAPGAGGSQETSLTGYFADQTGTSNDPKLVITYTSSAAYTATYNETVSLSETFSKATTKPLAETVTIAQTFSNATAKSFTMAISLSETFSKATEKSFNLAVTLAESFSRAITISRTFTETVTIVSSLTKGFAKTFNLTISVKDWFWRWLRKPTSNFSQQTPNSDTWTEETPSDDDWTRN